MEFRHIRYFIAVAEELHFGKAAIRLNMSQPPLSQQIQALENELGIQLLVRNKHKVALTNAGKIFLDRAYAILDEVQLATKISQQASQGITGLLKIGFTGLFSFTEIMHILIQKYRETYPNIEICFYERSSMEQIDLLVNKKLDLGFTLALPSFHSSDIETHCLLSEPLMVVLPTNHILCKHEFLTMPMLIHDRFILYERSHGAAFYEKIVKMCISAGFTPEIFQEVRTMTAVVGLVGAGLGVSIVSSSMQRIQIPNVVYRSLKDEAANTDVLLIHRKGDPSILIDNFLQVLGS